MRDKKTVKKTSEEEYEITNEELLTLQLLETRLGKANADLQLASQIFEVFKQSLAGKYSEYGKYKLVGEVNLNTRQGTRVLIPE